MTRRPDNRSPGALVVDASLKWPLSHTEYLHMPDFCISQCLGPKKRLACSEHAQRWIQGLGLQLAVLRGVQPWGRPVVIINCACRTS
eukprot:575972-Pelagomonas_calceolata.AAC.2